MNSVTQRAPLTFLSAAVLILLLLLANGCSGQARLTPAPYPTTDPATLPALPKGERLLSIDVTEGEDGFDAAFALAQGVGMDATSLTVFWDDIETAPGKYSPDPNWLAVANLFYFLELGYPSGADNDSSASKQAEFVRQAFQAWDAYPDQVKLIAFSWLTDIDPADVKMYTRYYGVRSKGFASYLGTLGLRTYEGEDKAAFRALVEEAERRGW